MTVWHKIQNSKRQCSANHKGRRMAMKNIFNVMSIKVAVFLVFLFILSAFLPGLFLEEARAGERKYWQRGIGGNFTGFNWCTIQCDPIIYDPGDVTITNCNQSIQSGDTAFISCGGTVNFNGNFSVYDFDARGSAVFNHMAGELAVQNEFDSSCSYNLSGGKSFFVRVAIKNNLWRFLQSNRRGGFHRRWNSLA